MGTPSLGQDAMRLSSADNVFLLIKTHSGWGRGIGVKLMLLLERKTHTAVSPAFGHVVWDIIV